MTDPGFHSFLRFSSVIDGRSSMPSFHLHKPRRRPMMCLTMMLELLFGDDAVGPCSQYGLTLRAEKSLEAEDSNEM